MSSLRKLINMRNSKIAAVNSENLLIRGYYDRMSSNMYFSLFSGTSNVIEGLL